jgi:hypothetical protein
VSITSTLDGKKELPIRIRWIAHPRLPASQGADSMPPLVSALPQLPGRVGHPLTFRFSVADDSGYAATTVAVFRGTARIWLRVAPLHKVVLGQTYTVQWKPSVAGALKFCVDAADGSRNLSRMSCAPVRVAK